jgi:hypothetical protein
MRHSYAVSFSRKRIGTYSQQHHGAVAIAGSERKRTMLSVWKKPGDYDHKIEATGDGGACFMWYLR